MKFPRPQDSLAGCVWLPRFLAKARLFKKGTLPPDYVARFCHPTGVDAQFLNHFGLTREDFLAAVDLPDDNFVKWFLGRTSPERIEAWNKSAMNFGRPGYPMAERFPVAMSTTYKHLADRGFTTVFEMLEADEAGA